MSKIIIPIAMTISVAVFLPKYLIPYYDEDRENTLAAEKVIYNKNNLENEANIINLTKKTPVTDESEIAYRNINSIIIPDKNMSAQDKSLIVKYDRSVKKWMKLNDPSINPTCTDLATLSIITFSDCTKAEALDVSFFNYDDKIITYDIETDVAKKIVKIGNSSQATLDIKNNEVYTIRDIDKNYTKLAKKQKENLKKQEELVNKKITEKLGRAGSSLIDVAAANHNIAKTNPDKAISNAKRIVEKARLDSSLTVEQKKEIAKKLKMSELLIMEKKAVFDNTNSTSDISDVTDYISENITETELEEVTSSYNNEQQSIKSDTYINYIKQ